MQPSDIIIQVHLYMEALQVNFYYPATFMERTPPRLATFHKCEHAHAHRLQTFHKRNYAHAHRPPTFQKRDTTFFLRAKTSHQR